MNKFTEIYKAIFSEDRKSDREYFEWDEVSKRLNAKSPGDKKELLKKLQELKEALKVIVKVRENGSFDSVIPSKETNDILLRIAVNSNLDHNELDNSAYYAKSLIIPSIEKIEKLLK